MSWWRKKIAEGGQRLQEERAEAGIIVNVPRCIRCGHHHEQLHFRPLNNPPDEYTHWAACPDTFQPILLAVVEEGD